MLKPSKRVTCAIVILRMLRGSISPIPVSALAKILTDSAKPEVVTSGAAQQFAYMLVRAGLVKTKRGPLGGYYLASHKPLSVYDLMVAIHPQGKIDTPARNLLDKISGAIDAHQRSALKNILIDDVLRS